MNCKQKLLEALDKVGGLKSVRLGSTIYIHCASNEGEVYRSLVKKAIRSGDGIYFSDGSREWYEWTEVFDLDKEKGKAGAGYIWHKDGNRCLHELVKHVVKKDGSHEKIVIKKAYRELESI